MSVHDDITIEFKGVSMSLEAAARRTESALKGVGEAEKRTGQEGAIFGERMTKAAEGVALLGAESSEAILKVNRFGAAFRDLQEATRSFSGAVGSMAVSFAAFKTIDILKESVDEAMQGEAAFARLAASFKGNTAAFQQTKDAIEQSSAAFARYGMTVGQVAGLIAQARGKGLDASTILGSPDAIADLAKALNSDLGGAVQAMTSGPRGVMQIGRALNLSLGQMNNLRAQLNAAGNNANLRAQDILAAVERSQFAGQGSAAADTASGKMIAFQTSMKDLEETLGEGLLPLMTNFATTLTTIVQGANTALQAFGGLQGILSQKWIPAVLVGLGGMKALHSIFVFFENLLKTKFLSSMQQTRQEMDAADKTTQQYVKDLKDIPPSVDTKAFFDPTRANALKEPYIANIHRVPTSWKTVATFVPATAAINAYERQLATIPHGEKTAATVMAKGRVTSWTEAPAPAVKVTGRVTAWAEAAATPVKTTGTVTGWSEAAATPVKVTGSVTGWSEAAATPVKTTGTVTGWSEAAATPVRVTGTVTGWSGATAVPVKTTGTVTSWAEAAATPIKTTGTITSWSETPPTVNVIGHITGWTEAAVPTPTTTGSTGTTGTTTTTAGKGKVVSTTGIITSWAEAAATPVKTTGIVTSWSEAAATPVKTSGIVTSWSEAAATPVKTTGTITGWTGTPPNVKVTGTVTGVDATIKPTLDHNWVAEINGIKHEMQTYFTPMGIPVTIKGENNLSLPQEADAAHTALQNELDKDGPLTVQAKPKWVSGALGDLSGGLAGGVAIAVTDMVVQHMQVQGNQPPTTPTTPHKPTAPTTHKPTTPPRKATGPTKTIVSDPALEAMAAHPHTRIDGTPTVRVAGVVNTHSVDNNVAGTAATDIGLSVMQALIMGAVMRGFSGANIASLVGQMLPDLAKLVVPTVTDWTGSGGTPAPPGKKPQNTPDLQRQQAEQAAQYKKLVDDLRNGRTGRLLDSVNAQNNKDAAKNITATFTPFGIQFTRAALDAIAKAMQSKSLETSLGQDFLGVMEAAGEAAADQAKAAVGNYVKGVIGPHLVPPMTKSHTEQYLPVEGSTPPYSGKKGYVYEQTRHKDGKLWWDLVPADSHGNPINEGSHPKGSKSTVVLDKHKRPIFGGGGKAIAPGAFGSGSGSGAGTGTGTGAYGKMIAPAGTYNAALASINAYAASLGYTQNVAAGARGRAATTIHQTFNCPITINGQSDPDRAAKSARQQLEDFVRGAASGTRLHG